jgi:hypothetical protein
MITTKTTQIKAQSLASEEAKASTYTETMESQESFSVSHLPPELRHKIYASYFTTLPPLEINPSNISTKHHLTTPLALASPFFESDIPSTTFYSSTTFSFSSGKAIQYFAEQQRNIKRIKIEYGQEKGLEAKNRDWVYLMHTWFESLEEAIFEVGEKGDGDFGAWWGCVRDAVREGWCCRNQKGKVLVLRCEFRGKEVVRELVKA